jgi:cytochrome c-type biogenesis protein CcmE
MTYFKQTADSSYLYRPTSGSETSQYTGTAVNANLADLMRNSSIVRETVITPTVIVVNDPAPDTHVRWQDALFDL